MTISNRNQKGFTLVELLIVVIILGILAAVVIPQFNSAASESKEAALASNLATIRQAIEMYKVQHNDVFPNNTIATVQLVDTTDISGAAVANGPYGPYLRNDFPNNPMTGTNTVKFITGNAPAGPPTGTEAWLYSTTTGEFRANNTGTGPSGIDFYDL